MEEKRQFKLNSQFDEHILREGDDPQLPNRVSTGKQLATARSQLNLSVQDIASSLRLAPEIIRAVEKQQYDKLFTRAYATGYVRAYAEFVNLNADNLINQDPELGLTGIQDEIEPSRHSSHITSRNQTKPTDGIEWIGTAFRGAVVLSVLTVLLLGWNYRHELTDLWNKFLQPDVITTEPKTESTQEQPPPEQGST